MKRHLFLLAVIVFGLATQAAQADSATRAACLDHAPQVVTMSEHDRSVYRLYCAYFLRQPEPAGYAYWRDHTDPLRAISQHFAASDEFASLYGSVSDAQFVNLVYRNVLGRSPDLAGEVFWGAQLAAGMPRGELMILFSNSPEYTHLVPAVNRSQVVVSPTAPTTTAPPTTAAPTTTAPAPTTSTTTTAPAPTSTTTTAPPQFGSPANPYPQGHQTYGHDITTNQGVDVGTGWMPGTYLRTAGPNCWILEIWFTKQDIPAGWDATTALYSTTGNRVEPDPTPCAPVTSDYWTDIGQQWYGWHPNAQVEYHFTQPANAQWATTEISVNVTAAGSWLRFWDLADVWPHADYEPWELNG